MPKVVKFAFELSRLSAHYSKPVFMVIMGRLGSWGGRFAEWEYKVFAPSRSKRDGKPLGMRREHSFKLCANWNLSQVPFDVWHGHCDYLCDQVNLNPNGIDDLAAVQSGDESDWRKQVNTDKRVHRLLSIVAFLHPVPALSLQPFSVRRLRPTQENRS